MIGRLCFALALSVLAQPVSALSCMKPDIARSFLQAEASDQLFTVVLGQLEFDPLVPPFDGNRAPETSIPARFVGSVLGQDGFSRKVSREIILQVSCVVNTWCGSAADPGTRVLAFLRHRGDDLVLDLDPCPQWLFANPSAAQIGRVGECFTGGPCG